MNSSSPSASYPSASRRKPYVVVHVLNWLPVGGVERIVLDLLPRLDPERFRSHIVLLRERGPLADLAEKRGIPVHLAPLRTRLSPSGLWWLSRLFRSLKADIVHSHMYRSNTSATIAAQLAGVPAILAHVHNVETWESLRQLWMDQILSRGRSSIIVVSERVKQNVLKRLHLRPEKVHLLYNGIDITNFHPNPENREAGRRAEGIPADAVVAVCVARLVEQKNHLGLLQAFAAIADRYPTLMLWLIGKGPMLSVLDAEVRRLGLAERVRFAGQRTDIHALLPLADFSVLASFREGLPIFIIESLATGLPMLVTDVGGNAEAVRNGVEGIVISAPGDTRALSDALARLASDSEERTRMATRARERACEFSIDVMARRVESLYLKLMKQV